MDIQMVDLQAQVAAIRGELQEAIDAVLVSGAYVRGPFVHRFEEELATYLGGRFAIGVGNGTDALQIAFMALGVKPGDEVVCPSFTFVATAEAAAVLGATLVFVDIDPRTFNIDAALLEDSITERTRAIVPVHLFGQAAEMDAVRDVARRHDIPVVEDAAQAVGAHYGAEPCGYVGEIGCLSFYPSKNLGAFGDGGAILTNDEALAERCRMIANHGSRKKYHNEIVGMNSRLDAMQAAMLSVKLRHLDGWTSARQRAAELYDRLLEDSGVELPHRAGGRDHVFHQYTIRVKAQDRDRLREHLRRRGVPSMIYYPVPLHHLPVFTGLGYEKASLPESERAAHEVISLPMHPHLSTEHIRHIAESVHEFMRETESIASNG
jgi:UDP-2-acetamido-2-deoxy-ribo-hexuluronate aminotransferase